MAVDDIIIGESGKPIDVPGGIKVNGTTVVNNSGKVVESAGIEISDGDTFDDNNSNEALTWGVVAAAVNNLKITNAITTNGPILSAVGDDANIDVNINPKGTGSLVTGKLDVGSSTAVSSILDEDNMASDSATALATQQSIKAYVDSQVATADSLQEVFDNGQTITIADTDNQTLVLNQNDVTNNLDAFQINNAGTGDELQMTSTAAGATGVVLHAHHNSASPLSADVVFRLLAEGEDDGSNVQEYGRIDFVAQTVTDTTELGEITFYSANGAGTSTLVGSFSWESSTAPALVLGDGTNNPTLTTAGAANLILDTNAGSTSSSITINNGAAGNILLTPDAAGQVVIGNAGNVAVITSAGLDTAIQTGGASVANFLIGSAAASNVVLTLDTTGIFQVSGSAGQQIYSNDGGATGATLELYHESASPLVGDNSGIITFQGEDDGDNKTEYAKINTQLLTITAGSEECYLYFSTQNGSGSIAANLGLYWSTGIPYASFGDGTAAPIITSGGSQNLTLQTGAASTGTITLTQGANANITITPNGSGALDIAGAVIHSDITTSSGAAAVPVTGRSHEITTTGTGDALTLANGTQGQRLSLVYVAEGAGADTAVLTPTTLAGGTTITFNALGDTAELEYHTTGGWYMMGGSAVIA